MSQIPWWGLPLIAAVFTLVGAVVAQLFTVRNRYFQGRVSKTRRWYEERKTAYVDLLAAFERAFYRLRAAYAAGEKEPDPLVYQDEVGPALMHVRLLASGPVRSAAVAVHLLLEQVYGGLRPSSVPGVEPEKHLRELLVQVPLVMQQFEAAIREELEISTTPPQSVEPVARSRFRRAAPDESSLTG